MATRRLPAGMAEKLKYYVYLYVDPDTGVPFYVGKGKWNRVFAHLDDPSNSAKTKKIRQLLKQGKEPRIEILAHGFEDEVMAYRVEMAAIQLLGKHTLTNQVLGLESGVYGRTLIDDLIPQIAQEPVEIVHPVILIRINQMFRFDMTDEELYEATRGVWRMSERRYGARYALAIFDGIVREVYRIDSWHEGGSTPYATRTPGGEEWRVRWEFVGEVAGRSIRNRYRLKSVRHYFPKNYQSPIWYENC